MDDDAERLRKLGIVDRPRSPDASPESLRRLGGIIRLTGPIPQTDLFDDEDAETPPKELDANERANSHCSEGPQH